MAPNNIHSHSLQSKYKIPMSVWLIGFCMCLVNISFVMIFGISAVYLNSLMGVAVGWILFLEGLGETISFLMKLFSGMISDYFKRRKPLIVVGYGLVLVSKFMLAMSTTFSPVFISTIIERVGNGTQATPRDALISDVAPPGSRGVCFGLKRSLGVAGSFMGAAIGFVIMYYTKDSFRTVFWLATIPVIIAFVILVFIVKDADRCKPFTAEEVAATKKNRRPLRFADLPLLGKGYWTLIAVVFLFMMARIGEHSLVLHAKKTLGIRDTFAPLLIMMYNMTYSLSSYPVGWLSDKVNRTTLLAFSILVLVISDLLLAFSTTQWGIFSGIVMWGVQMGAVQSVVMVSIADMAPDELRGTAFGFYYLLTAVATLVAGSWSGYVAQNYGNDIAYFVSSIVAMVSMLVLIIMRPYKKHRLLANAHQ